MAYFLATSSGNEGPVEIAVLEHPAHPVLRKHHLARRQAKDGGQALCFSVTPPPFDVSMGE